MLSQENNPSLKKKILFSVQHYLKIYSGKVKDIYQHKYPCVILPPKKTFLNLEITLLIGHELSKVGWMLTTWSES